MRVPKPFFRKFTDSWYVQISKRQINLGPDEAAAWKRYHAIMAEQVTDDESLTVAVLLDRFLDWSQRNQAGATYDFYFRFLQSFAQHIGRRLKLRQLKPYHVSQWTATSYAENSPTTVHHAITTVKRAMNWAAREGYIEASPIAHLPKPSRGKREIALTPDQWEAVYSAAQGDAFRDLITVLRETGCRPQEARIVQAKYFDRQFKRWVLPRELSKGKRASRIVYLNPAALTVIERLATKYPEGPLFRNSQGKPWTKDSINCRFRRLKRILKIDGLCAYVIRHTYATQSLINGVDAQTVAELMGHADTTMLSQVYQHLRANPDYLAQSAQKATKKTNPASDQAA